MSLVSSRFVSQLACAAALLALSACSDVVEPDAGPRDGSIGDVESFPDAARADARVDTGVPDAGFVDTGTQPVDTGVADTGPTPDAGEGPRPENVLYVGSNIPVDGASSILGYRRATDGRLTPLPGSPYLTGGKGTGNPTRVLGVNESNSQVLASADRRFMFAVNQGSDSIAVMRINSDGSLTPVPGSPFPSGATQPVSLAILSPTRLWVAHKNQDPTRPNGTGEGYYAFDIDPQGRLTPVPALTVTSRSGSSPSELWPSNDRRVMFSTDLFNAVINPPMGSFRAFVVTGSGALAEGPNSPFTFPPGNPAPPVALGVITHPTDNVVYVGLPARQEVAAFEFDNDARLTLRGTETSSGGVAICWLATNRAGTRLYSANSGDNSISVFDTTTSTQPRVLQHLVQTDSGPGGFPVVPPSSNLVSSQGFNLELSPDERFLYVVNARSTTDETYTRGNSIHVHDVLPDGRLREASYSPIDLPVPTSALPAGLVMW